MRWFLVALIAGFVVVPAVTARAHATYRASNPAKDARVSSPPAEVWVEFTEQPSDGSGLQIYGPCGERVDSGRNTISVVPGQNRITTDMSSDRGGVHRVDWSVLSDVDGHRTAGSFTFVVGEEEPCSAEPEPEGPPEPREDPEGDRDPVSSPQQETGAGPASTGPREPPRRDDQVEGPAEADSPRPADPPDPAASPMAQSSPTPTATSDISIGSILAVVVIAFVIGVGGGIVYRGIVATR